MAGHTNRAFRMIVKKMGAGLVFGEFVSADGLVRQNAKSLELIQFDRKERPFGIQLFGNDPSIMANAAQIVESFQPDLIDLNFGCPVPKVVKKGAGAALLNDIGKLSRIAGQVVQAVSIPVTAKIRSGWDKNHIVAEKAAKSLENVGIHAITIHPRTKTMGYSGKADWNLIKKVKKIVSIPVIGNGDIWEANDVFRMIEETKCDYVMIARGALRNPWIFKQVNLIHQKLDLNYTPSDKELLQLMREHLNLAVKYDVETRAIKEMRKFLAFYLKGKPGAGKIRNTIHSLETIEEIDSTLTDFFYDRS